MSNWSLLRVMVLKEIRTTFRERSQLRALVVSVVFLVIAIGGSISKIAHSRPAMAPGTRAANSQPETAAVRMAQAGAGRGGQAPDAPVARWVAVGGAGFAGFFFSMGYLISAVLASFVGEKEARTLEILLASPISNGKLYFIKCVSVLLPTAAIGGFFAVAMVVVVMIFIPPGVIPLSTGMLILAMVLGAPLMLLAQLWFVGLGAAISVRAETMKGASQALGAVIMILVFGSMWGTPLLLSVFPGIRPPIVALVTQWLALPFPVQYSSVFLGLGLISAICLTIGRVSFRRDRMLT